MLKLEIELESFLNKYPVIKELFIINLEMDEQFGIMPTIRCTILCKQKINNEVIHEISYTNPVQEISNMSSYLNSFLIDNVINIIKFSVL